LAQLDIGITNSGILYFEAHPELKNKEGQNSRFNESIANHFIQARSISWEALYGDSILDIDSQTPGNESDDDYNIMHQLGVLNMTSDRLSPMKAVVDVCNPCSPFDKEFMDNQEIKYLKKKGVDNVELKVLKSQLGKRGSGCFANLCTISPASRPQPPTSRALSVSHRRPAERMHTSSSHHGNTPEECARATCTRTGWTPQLLAWL
jgi:hypothetical protein